MSNFPDNDPASASQLSAFTQLQEQVTSLSDALQQERATSFVLGEQNAQLQAEIETLGERNADLHYRVTHDRLTGLLSREGLAEVIPTFREGDKIVALDLDRFKTINDTFGHAVGDEELDEFGHKIRHAIRPGDIGARIGGDEFLLVLRGGETDADDVSGTYFRGQSGEHEVPVSRIMARLTGDFEEDVTQSDHRVFLQQSGWGMTAGIATISTGGYEQALLEADRDLYLHKPDNTAMVGGQRIETIPQFGDELVTSVLAEFGQNIRGSIQPGDFGFPVGNQEVLVFLRGVDDSYNDNPTGIFNGALEVHPESVLAQLTQSPDTEGGTFVRIQFALRRGIDYLELDP